MDTTSLMKLIEKKDLDIEIYNEKYHDATGTRVDNLFIRKTETSKRDSYLLVIFDNDYYVDYSSRERYEFRILDCEMKKLKVLLREHGYKEMK